MCYEFLTCRTLPSSSTFRQDRTDGNIRPRGQGGQVSKTEQAALRLEVLDIKDADHWTWRLRDPLGNFLADHPVALDRADVHYQAQ